MKIQCLGSGDAFASGGRFNSCYFIQTSNLGILLDCGASALISMKRNHLTLHDIDVVIISHLHGDHFGGLPFLLCEILVTANRRKPFTIIGPEMTRQRVTEALTCFYPRVELTEDSPIAFLTYSSGKPFTSGGIEIIAYPAVHTPETNPHSLQLKVQEKIIAYSGDTEWNEHLIQLTDGADLFICEASTYQYAVKTHMSVNKLLNEQHRIHAKRIVLTHLGEDALKHQQDIPFAIANDGDILMED